MQMGQPSLFTEVRTGSLLSPMNNSPCIPGRDLFLGKGTYGVEAFLLYKSLKLSNLNLKDGVSHHKIYTCILRLWGTHPQLITSEMPPLHLNLRENRGRGARKIASFRSPGCLLTVSFCLSDREAVPMNSQQCGCLNKTSILATPVARPMQSGEIPHGSPQKKSHRCSMPEKRGNKSVSSRDKLPIQPQSPDTCIFSKAKWSLLVIYMHAYLYV